MKKIQQGFTLIELMIVIAIIGILAAIAIPQYNDYVSRSQAAGSLSEISGGRTAYEERLQRGADNTSPSDIGLQGSTERCTSISVNNYNSSDGSADPAIKCTMSGNPTIDGNTIQLARDSAGSYTCEMTASIDSDLRPDGCDNDV